MRLRGKLQVVRLEVTVAFDVCRGDAMRQAVE